MLDISTYLESVIYPITLVNSHFFENFEKNMRNLRSTVQGCLQAGFVIFCKKKIVQDPFFYTIDIFRPQDNELF